MAEPTVQVPVSRLEKWRDDLAELLPPGTYAIRNELDALLSQSTPSAEADRVFRCDDCGDEFDDDHYGDAKMHADRHSHNVPSWTMPSWDTPVASPSIADMAPGTTFTAEFKESGRRTLFVKVGGTTAWPLLAVEWGALATYTEYAIDPSTIRDVTPPKGPTA